MTSTPRARSDIDVVVRKLESLQYDADQPVMPLVVGLPITLCLEARLVEDLLSSLQSLEPLVVEDLDVLDGLVSQPLVAGNRTMVGFTDLPAGSHPAVGVTAFSPCNHLVNRLLARGGATAALQAEVLEYEQISEHLEKICEVSRMEAGLVAIEREMAEMNPAVREPRRLADLSDHRPFS
jgi:hypothetical protein